MNTTPMLPISQGAALRALRALETALRLYGVDDGWVADHRETLRRYIRQSTADLVGQPVRHFLIGQVTSEGDDWIVALAPDNETWLSVDKRCFPSVRPGQVISVAPPHVVDVRDHTLPPP